MTANQKVPVPAESTQDYDRGSKFMRYRAVASLQEYVLIEQEKIHIERFRRLEDGRWILDEFDQADQVLSVAAIDFEMPLQRIYRNVKWEDA